MPSAPSAADTVYAESRSTSLTGSGIAGKAAGLELEAGAKNTTQMKLSKAASGKATFTIVLETNGRPTTETRSVTVVSK